MGKKSGPPTPDYAELARQQGAANEATARVEGAINRPDIYTPNGSQVWQRHPTDPDRYILTESLNPQLRDNNDMYNWIQGAALGALGQHGIPAVNQALSQNYGLPGQAPLGWDPALAPDQRMQTESGMWAAPAVQERLNFDGAPGIPSASDQTRQSAEQAMYSRAQRYLDPQWQGRRADTEAKLANQGIMPGSEAYEGAMASLGRDETMAYGDALDRAIASGGDEMARQFGMGMSARQQGVGEIAQQGQFANAARGQLISELLQNMQQRNAAISGQANIASAQQQSATGGRQAALAEQAQAYTLPVNILNALLSSSQVNAPQYQPFNNQIQVGQTPILAAGQMQHQADMDRFNAQQAGLGNWLNLAGRVGSAAISDRRFKSNIVRVGSLGRYPLYEYIIFGERQRGVMADEVPAAARLTLPSGVQMVFYDMLAEA